MKTKFTLLFTFACSIILNAQIVITPADMPVANDTFRISTASNSVNFNFAATGTTYNWDFSNLTAASQKMESYVPLSATPLIYRLVFNSTIASIARERPDMQVAVISLTNGFDFFKKSATDYRQTGFGSEIQGISLPVQFQSPDILYKFPVNFGNSDSCDSKWNVNIPNLGYLGEKKHRVNEVDGWGTVKTPYGTFNCLRIKSTVLQIDSFHYDSIPLPFPAIPQNYIEYYWLAKNIGFPILKATVRLAATTVEYIDSIKVFAGIAEDKASNNDLVIFPNPTTDLLNINFLTNISEKFTIRIFSTDGKELLNKSYNSINKIVINTNNLEKGIYFVTATMADKVITKQLIIR